MPKLRSATTTHGRNMAGARALWRATGMTDQDFGKPIIAVVNSFTQFVPGHVHLKDLGQLVAREIEAAGGVAKEFNTIAVDDGIAMGHGGMLYSLPSRELIADSVEYMVNAHCADAMVCISNCDKITPGMLMAALRINIPVDFRLRRSHGSGQDQALRPDHQAGSGGRHDPGRRPQGLRCQSDQIERSACPTCGSCSGMFTANSMNCLTEALGLSQPGNGSPAGDPRRPRAAVQAGGPAHRHLAKRWYEQDDASALPRNIATKAAFENAMALDIAMGGSTNTVLHLLAAAQEAGVDFTMADIDRMSRKVPQLCKVAPSTQKYHMEDVHRAGGVVAILGQLEKAGLVHGDTRNVLGTSWWSCWPNMTSAAAMTRGFTTSTVQALPASVPPRRSVRIAAGPSWIWTAPRGASAPSITPTARKVAWRSSLATSPSTGPSSRPPGWTRRTSPSAARPGYSRARRAR